MTEACVTLDATGPEVLLRVADRGVGFNPSGLHSAPGLGLSSMEEGVRPIGAKLSIRSACGQGTTVEVSVPLARKER